ncbi:MAG: hypothetical protein JWO20_996 [Candidatus Angelobacter sp.]|nr:hypothetical protein [Candidatus Angelobacter sp.]
MGICTYCGQKAGWLSDVHTACIEKAEFGIAAINNVVMDAVTTGKTYDEISAAIKSISAQNAVPQDKVVLSIKDGWSKAAVEKGVKQPVSDDELSIALDVFKKAGITSEEMVSTAGFRQMAFSCILWRVLHDQMTPYEGPITFNLHRDEIPVFGMANVLLSEERKTSSYEGTYGGATIRIGNGLYYHLGGVQGHRVQSNVVQEVDYGDFLMTTEAVYFGGTEHGINFRIPYAHIVRFNPFKDAVGICKDGSKQQTFAPQQHNDCGWFLFNVLQALSTRTNGRNAHYAGNPK